MLLPELTGRELRWPGLLRSLPWVASTGLLVFGSAGLKRLIYRFRYGASVPEAPAAARTEDGA